MIDWYPSVAVVGLYQTFHGKCGSLKLDQKAQLLSELGKEEDEKVKLGGRIRQPF